MTCVYLLSDGAYAGLTVCEGPIDVDEHGVTPPLVYITALTGLVGYPEGLQGHVAAPLCHEPERHFELFTQAQYVLPPPPPPPPLQNRWCTSGGEQGL